MLPAELAVFSMLAKALEIEEERRGLQEALIRSEDKYRSLVEGNLYPISIIDSRGVIRYCNKVMATVFRYTQPSSLLGRSFAELLHPDDRRQFEDLVLNLGQHRSVQPEQTLEFRGLASDDTSMDIRVTMGMIFFDGRPALHANLPHFAGRHDHGRPISFASEQSSGRASAAYQLTALSRVQLDVVDVHAHRNVFQGHGVAGDRFGVPATAHDITGRQSRWRQNVAMLAILILEQRDVAGPIGVILYCFHSRVYAIFEAFKVDFAIDLADTATSMSGSDFTAVIAPAFSR